MHWLNRLFGIGAASPDAQGPTTAPAEGKEFEERHVLHPRKLMLRGPGAKASKNIARNLFHQQQTGRPRVGSASHASAYKVIGSLRGRLDQEFNGVPILVLDLESAIKGYKALAQAGLDSDLEWKAVSDAVGAIAQKLLMDVHHAHGPPTNGGVGTDGHPGDQVQLDREAFVMFSGPESLLKVLQPPFGPTDARQMDSNLVMQRAEAWCDVLVVLRELCFSVPELAHRMSSEAFVMFLFTLLSQSVFFDPAAGLIEEILADQPHTFDLGLVLDLAGLLRGFSFRQLAHFCRVLAVLVFEPEDRHLMESTKVLKSLEILQLRRDRMVRGNSAIDRNQALLLGVPDILDRLVKLLRVMNHGPPLREVSHSSTAAHMHVPPYEVLLMLGGSVADVRDWDTLEQLEALAASSTDGDDNQARETSVSAATVVGAYGGDDGGVAPLSSFVVTPAGAPTTGVDGLGALSGTAGGVPVNELMNILSPLLASPSPPELNVRQILQLVQTVQALNVGQEHGQVNPAAPIVLQRLQRRTPPRTPAEAANELQFNALLLTQHQVEVLFVLCTLLGGRRKIDVQRALADLGLIPILSRMFDRLSWGYVPDGPNPMERIHGPGCECNPESALRVQFLRLIHNFSDRDAMTVKGSHKHLLLSDNELQLLETWQPMGSPRYPDPDSEKGMLTKIVQVLMAEPADSVYRFWLASCVESFLRGSSPVEQCFVACTGLLVHLVKEITSEGLKCAGSLQTAFDLLGELTKGNLKVLEMLDAALTDAEFQRLMEVVTCNLVDSNVFVRALLLTLSEYILLGEPQDACEGLDDESDADETEADEHEHARDGEGGTNMQKEGESLGGREGGRRVGRPCGNDDKSYLLHSWWDIVPLPISATVASNSAVDVDADTLSGHMAGLSVLDRESETSKCRRVPRGHPLYRLTTFLSTHHIRLLRDLMSVVDLSNVNHENICCLNTAVVLLIFAHRRHRLPHTLRRLAAVQAAHPQGQQAAGSEAQGEVPYTKARDVNRPRPASSRPASVHEDEEEEFEGLGRGCSCLQRDYTRGWASGYEDIEECTDFLRNFRELLWFHREYYQHRGRDRLSLEFSSHIRFPEWKKVVDLLCADDGSPTALVSTPLALPLSPYCLPPRRQRHHQAAAALLI